MMHLYQSKSGLHLGDLLLSHDVEFHGLVTGSVTVPPGKRLRLHGRIAGDLVVQANAYAAVYGSVTGAVLNQGAEVTILGRAGALHRESSTVTMINDAPKSAEMPAVAASPAETPAQPLRRKPRRR